jgi:hypothetical protein
VVYPGRMDAETLEALACREAVSLALDVGARRVKVASDCSNVIASLEQGTLGVYAHIIQDINESRCRFDVLSFVHERRLSNKEAHRLAKSSVLLDQGRHVWLLDPHLIIATASTVNRIYTSEDADWATQPSPSWFMSNSQTSCWRAL